MENKNALVQVIFDFKNKKAKYPSTLACQIKSDLHATKHLHLSVMKVQPRVYEYFSKYFYVHKKIIYCPFYLPPLVI